MRCERVVLHVAAGVEGGLEVDAADGRVLDGEVDDAADFVLVDAALDGGDEGDVEADGGEAIEGEELFGEDVGLAADDAIGLGVEAVELEVERGADFVELGEEAVVVCDALAVGVDHSEGNAAGLCGADEVHDLRDGWWVRRRRTG